MSKDLSVEGTSMSKPPTGLAVPPISARRALEIIEDKFASRYRRVKDAFVQMDLDCDGYVSKNEFRIQLRLLGIELYDHEYSKLWSFFDTKNKGRLAYSEFNNKVGDIIHPPSTSISNRPETPRIRNANCQKFAVNLQQKMKSLEEAFYKVNSSGSGTISQSELQQALRDVGLPKIEDEETHQMIQKYKSPDDDHLGLSFNQFRRAMRDFLQIDDAIGKAKAAHAYESTPIRELSHAERLIAAKLWGRYADLQKAFRNADKSGNGKISTSDMRFLLKELGVKLVSPDFRDLCEKYDPTNQGWISYDEFNSKVGSLVHPSSMNLMLVHKNKSGVNKSNKRTVAEPLRASTPERTSPYLSEKSRMLAKRLGLSVAEAEMTLASYGRFRQLQNSLRRFDVGGSGKLSSRDFQAAIVNAGVSVNPSTIPALVQEYTAGENYINFNDLVGKLGGLWVENDRNAVILGIEEPFISKLEETTRQESVSEDIEEKSQVRPLNIEACKTSVPSPTSQKHETASAVSSISTRSVNLDTTREKMLKILGPKSLSQVYRMLQKHQEKHGYDSGVVDTDHFRDVCAAKGIPLTSKEVKALSAQYMGNSPGAKGKSDVHYQDLLDSTFSANGATASRPATATLIRKNTRDARRNRPGSSASSSRSIKSRMSLQ